MRHIHVVIIHSKNDSLLFLKCMSISASYFIGTTAMTVFSLFAHFGSPFRENKNNKMNGSLEISVLQASKLWTCTKYSTFWKATKKLHLESIIYTINWKIHDATWGPNFDTICHCNSLFWTGWEVFET